MRVAVLGAAKSIHTVKWVRALAKAGHVVELYSLPDHKAKDGVLDGITVHYLSHSGNAGYFFGGGELRRLLKKFKPDVLNAHYATGYGTLARRSGFHPVMLSVWGSDVYEFPYKSAVNKHILVKNLENATKIASTSNIMAKQVNKVKFISDKILITPFGVDTSVFCRCSEPEKGKLTIGIVKALEATYGIEYLIRAFSLLKKRMIKENTLPEKGIALEIYGGGSLRAELEKLAKELEIDKEVTFHGAVPHSKVPSIISTFDIFCAPSLSESFGVAAIEAMACEVVVVTSDADGFKEVVADGKTGFIVTRKDPVLLANKLYTLAQNPELRKEMGAAGRKHVKANYEWSYCVNAISNALTETVMKARNENIR